MSEANDEQPDTELQQDEECRVARPAYGAARESDLL